jgi:hypothetical protein
LKPRERTLDVVAPCWTVSHYITTPTAQSIVHAVKAAHPHIHRHIVHRVHHAFHAVTTHPGVWVETVCRAAPLVVAAGILSAPVTAPVPVPIAAETTPPTSVQPAAASQRPSLYASAPVTQPILFGYNPTTASPPSGGIGASPGTAPAESTLVTLPQNEAPPAPTAEQILAPYIATPQRLSGGTPSGIGTPGGIILTQAPGTSVPEPSSLAMLASGMAALALLRRRRGRG